MGLEIRKSESARKLGSYKARKLESSEPSSLQASWPPSLKPFDDELSAWSNELTPEH
jgi:hypothetical protein